MYFNDKLTLWRFEFISKIKPALVTSDKLLAFSSIIKNQIAESRKKNHTFHYHIVPFQNIINSVNSFLLAVVDQILRCKFLPFVDVENLRFHNEKSYVFFQNYKWSQSPNWLPHSKRAKWLTLQPLLRRCMKLAKKYL